MKRAIPPPNWLHTFEAAARCLSFTEAAEELGITPSAVSQQIRLLEQTLGVPLFHRLPKGLELTGDGLAYLPAVQGGFQGMAKSTRELFGGGRERLLTLRSNAAFAMLWLSPRLPRFQRAHPDVALRINVSIWLTETDWDGVSLEIRYGGGAWPGFLAERLTRERLFPDLHQCFAEFRRTIGVNVTCLVIEAVKRRTNGIGVSGLDIAGGDERA